MFKNQGTSSGYVGHGDYAETWNEMANLLQWEKRTGSALFI